MTMLKPRSGMQLTVKEFFALPEPWNKRKMELDEGALYIMTKPRLVHQFFQARLSKHMETYLDEFEDPPANVFADVMAALSLERRILLAPDLTIVMQGNAAAFRDQMVEGAPDIAVEILSSDRNRDLVRKRQLYAEAGVPEYWIIDAVNDTATILELENGGYVERAVLTADDTLTTPLPPGLSIPLADVFRQHRRPAEAEVEDC